MKKVLKIKIRISRRVLYIVFAALIISSVFTTFFIFKNKTTSQQLVHADGNCCNDPGWKGHACQGSEWDEGYNACLQHQCAACAEDEKDRRVVKCPAQHGCPEAGYNEQCHIDKGGGKCDRYYCDANGNWQPLGEGTCEHNNGAVGPCKTQVSCDCGKTVTVNGEAKNGVCKANEGEKNSACRSACYVPPTTTEAPQETPTEDESACLAMCIESGNPSECESACKNGGDVTQYLKKCPSKASDDWVRVPESSDCVEPFTGKSYLCLVDDKTIMKICEKKKTCKADAFYGSKNLAEERCGKYNVKECTTGEHKGLYYCKNEVTYTGTLQLPACPSNAKDTPDACEFPSQAKLCRDKEQTKYVCDDGYRYQKCAAGAVPEQVADHKEQSGDYTCSPCWDGSAVKYNCTEVAEETKSQEGETPTPATPTVTDTPTPGDSEFKNGMLCEDLKSPYAYGDKECGKSKYITLSGKTCWQKEQHRWNYKVCIEKSFRRQTWCSFCSNYSNKDNRELCNTTCNTLIDSATSQKSLQQEVIKILDNKQKKSADPKLKCTDYESRKDFFTVKGSDCNDPWNGKKEIKVGYCDAGGSATKTLCMYVDEDYNNLSLCNNIPYDTQYQSLTSGPCPENYIEKIDCKKPDGRVSYRCIIPKQIQNTCKKYEDDSRYIKVEVYNNYIPPGTNFIDNCVIGNTNYNVYRKKEDTCKAKEREGMVLKNKSNPRDEAAGCDDGNCIIRYSGCVTCYSAEQEKDMYACRTTIIHNVPVCPNRSDEHGHSCGDKGVIWEGNERYYYKDAGPCIYNNNVERRCVKAHVNASSSADACRNRQEHATSRSDVTCEQGYHVEDVCYTTGVYYFNCKENNELPVEAPAIMSTGNANSSFRPIFIHSLQIHAQSSYFTYTQDGLLIPQETGTYKFRYQGKEYQVRLYKEAKNRIYIDANNNGQKDASERFLDEVTKITQLKISPEILEYSYTLKPGYNFVHFPFVFRDTSLQQASGLLKRLQLNGNVSLISYYDGIWHTVDMFGQIGDNASGYMQDADFAIVPGRGYVIRNISTQDILTSFEGYPVDQVVPINFMRGWNLVGFYNPNKTYTASSLIKSINKDGKIRAVNVTRWDSGKYDGMQQENNKKYGFDFPIYWDIGYFVNIKNFNSDKKVVQWQDD